MECESEGKTGGKELRVLKPVKRNEDKRSGCRLPEGKSLLAPTPAPRKLMQRLGLSRAKIKAREIKNKSIMTAIEKTWRRTVEGASRVLMEKHYNRHKRLINDSY